MSFEGLSVSAEEVTVVPPSPTVLEFLNHSASMELNVADFDDPFSFDATTLSADDLRLRLYVSYDLFLVPVVFPLAHADSYAAVSSLFPTVTRSGCADRSPSNRP